MRKSPLPLLSGCLQHLGDLAVYCLARLPDRRGLQLFARLPSMILVIAAHLCRHLAFAHAWQDSAAFWSSLDRCSSEEVASLGSGMAAEWERAAAAEERASPLRLELPRPAVLASDPEAGLVHFA